MRTPIIAGNWKMHYTVEEAVEVIEELKPLVKGAECEVVICPTFVCLDAAVRTARGSNIKIGAQNMHFEKKGAYTGEVAPVMLEALGIDYVIIGHSERRQYFNETDETVNKKLKAAIAHNITPILCVGESLEERESNITEKIISSQIEQDLEDLSAEQVRKLVIAYEPIWAIGTGRTATADQANETIAFIRRCVGKLYGKETAEEVRIQYGGSVKPSTIREQMSKSDIDGALVGGASLITQDFSQIVKY